MKQLSAIAFRKKLFQWHDDNPRDMPWLAENNPYYIWLSEIMLQQTQVAQVIPYFKKFTKNYPTVQDLAKAPVEQVLKDWEGLGYYTRARNLHKAAQTIQSKHDGKFPTEFKEIIQLSGIGPYTAAAISSFAFNTPQVVVDTNVARVFSRLFGVEEIITSTTGKQVILDFANYYFDASNPGRFNQAIMNFGALQCVAKNPDCSTCPFEKNCFAAQHNATDLFPIKQNKTEKRIRYFNYCIVENKQHNIILYQRSGKDIWNGLFEFVLVEQPHSRKPNLNTILKHITPSVKCTPISMQCVFETKQQLTHQIINIRVFQILAKEIKVASPFVFIHKSKIHNYAFPGALREFLQNSAWVR